MASAGGIPRQQLIQLLVGMLAKKGVGMVRELERRIAAGQGLDVRGVHVDVSMLREALEQHRLEFGEEEEDDEEDEAEEAAEEEEKEKAESAAKVAATAAGARFTPPAPAQSGITSGGAGRWMPAAPSSSLLAARALQECEQAEVFARKVGVVSGAQVPIFKKPDVLSATTGQVLDASKPSEVVARFVSSKDGRVYLRLKSPDGWVSTRSLQDLSRVVLMGSPTTGQPLEPPKCFTTFESTATRILPLLDSNGQSVEGNGGATGVTARVAPPPPKAESNGNGNAASEDVPGKVNGAAEKPSGQQGEDEEEFEEDVDDEGEEEEDEFGEEDEEEDADGDLEDMEGDQETLESMLVDEQKKKEALQGGGPIYLKKVPYRRFRVRVGRVPLLAQPNAARLMTTTGPVFTYKAEFIADGVLFVPGEQRAYLHLKKGCHKLAGVELHIGNGWVCERTRTDIHKIAVVPVTKRKNPLTKKAARRVAFHGGDTDGVIGLRREDLIKNKQGRIVSKKQSEAAKKRYADQPVARWGEACKKAREELGLTGFVPMRKGTPIYEKAKEIYDKMDKF